jgi:hypothetical protein
MAVSPISNQNRLRNVFITGIVVGIVFSFFVSLLMPDAAVSSDDLKKVEDRLSAIEAKLQTPTPAPQASSAAQASLTLAALNKNYKDYIGQEVTLTGKINSPHQGVGFILIDSDGSFVWVHTKDQLPSGPTVTVKGKVEELKDQIATWKTETGWPADDATLTAKLRDEKIFVEASSVN